MVPILAGLDSQNSNTTAPSGRELYHSQFLPQVASLETFGYTLIGEKSFAQYKLKRSARGKIIR
jgi:hypothetical protein